MILISVSLFSRLAFGQNPTIQAVLNSASYTSQLSPGTWAAIFGTQLAPSPLSATVLPVPARLNGVSVTVAGKAAPVSYVSVGQINALIPFEAATLTATQTVSVPVVVTTPAGASAPFNITLQRNAPAIYSKDFSGTGAALFFDSNFKAGSTIDGNPIVLYATGVGPTDPPGNTNALANADGVLNRTTDAISLSVGGTQADILFSGLAPGYQGIYQLNVRPKGPFTNTSLFLIAGNSVAVPLTLPVQQGVNVKNVAAGVGILYPSTFSTGSPIFWSFSEVLAAARYSVELNIVQNASAFLIIATAGNASARITVDPVAKTWTSVSTVPSTDSRNLDFSSLLPAIPVLDFRAAGVPFPGNIVPASRLDYSAQTAVGEIPLQNGSTPSGSPNSTFVSSGSIPENNHLTLTGFFGGFQRYAKTDIGANIQFGIVVDGLVQSVKTATVLFQ